VSTNLADSYPCLLTTADVALHLGVSTATVTRLAAAGQLRRIRIGGSTRYDIADVESLISSSTARKQS
jgi:excisionase family DNA binding protein